MATLLTVALLVVVVLAGVSLWKHAGVGKTGVPGPGLNVVSINPLPS